MRYRGDGIDFAPQETYLEHLQYQLFGSREKVMTVNDGQSGDAKVSKFPQDSSRRHSSPPYLPRASHHDFTESDDQALEDLLDFWTLLRVLVKWWWLIALIMAAAVALTSVITLRQTPMYQATTVVEIKQEESNIIDVNEVEQINANAEFMATQFSLLRSRALAERIVQILNLSNDARFSDPSAPPAIRIDEAADKLINHTSVSAVGRSRLVNISYIDADPRLAARISDAVADNFIAYNLERKFNATSYAREFLEERLAATRSSLEESERKLVQYADEQRIVNIGGDSSGAQEGAGSLDSAALATLNTELTNVQTQRIDLEQRFNEARDNLFSSDIQNNGTIKSLQADLARLENEFQEKSQYLKADFPEMVELQGRIEAVSTGLQTERRNIVNTLQSQYQSLLAREQGLQERIDEVKRDVINLRKRSIDYNILQREVDTNRAQYDALLQRLKEISISDGVGSNLVSIVDRAEVPSAPFAPNLKRALLIAVVLSGAIGIGLVFALELIDDRIKLPDEIKNKLDLRVLGVVPILGKDGEFADAIKDSQSSISESYASTRTSLQFASANGAPQIIQLTSTRSGEGKSSSAFALAKSFASLNLRTLIIDADLRLPAFSKGTSQSIGLSGLLTSTASLEPQFVETEIDGLTLLPAGKVPNTPAELLSSHRFEEILTHLREQFEMIIIDGPPVLGLADAPILGAKCDATILVIEAGAIRTPTLKSTLDRLASSNTQVMGALFYVNVCVCVVVACTSCVRLLVGRPPYGHGHDLQQKM